MERQIDLNEYFASFPGGTFDSKISVTKLNEIILNSMTNSLSRHYYVQVFCCESITFKMAVNMFERMEISESIYEVVVESPY